MAIQTNQNLYFYGSVLSNDRCMHYVQLYRFAASHFTSDFTYSKLREESEKNNVLSNGAIRTFIPIFKGLGFVDYESGGLFSFKEDGHLFYHIQSALMAAKDLDEKRDAVCALLEDAKFRLILKGLVFLYKLDDDNSRKFQIIIQLLNRFNEVSLSEYLYAVNYSLENDTLDFDKLNDIIQECRNSGHIEDVYSWNSRAEQYEPTKDTATSYLKDLLRTARLIEDSDAQKIVASSLLPSFISMLS